MLFSGYKVAYEKKCKIMRDVVSVAEFTKSFFAEFHKVEDREVLEVNSLFLALFDSRTFPDRNEFLLRLRSLACFFHESRKPTRQLLNTF